MRQTFGYASAVSFQPENFLTSKIMCGDVSQSAHETRLDLAAEVLHRFGEVRFVARGSSMIPSIYPGDMVTVSSEGVMDARCGEIVLCLVGGRFFVHRVMRKWAERHRIVFATRGDALAQEDPSVDGTQLLGQVILIVRRGKSVGITSRANPWTRCMRWGVRNSSAFAKILLATHSLRSKVSSRGASTLADSPDQLQEFA
jgi:hypothetical protein